jgi:hypothetical protein
MRPHTDQMHGLCPRAGQSDERYALAAAAGAVVYERLEVSSSQMKGFPIELPACGDSLASSH